MSFIGVEFRQYLTLDTRGSDQSFGTWYGHYHTCKITINEIRDPRVLHGNIM